MTLKPPLALTEPFHNTVWCEAHGSNLYKFLPWTRIPSSTSTCHIPTAWLLDCMHSFCFSSQSTSSFPEQHCLWHIFNTAWWIHSAETCLQLKHCRREPSPLLVTCRFWGDTSCLGSEQGTSPPWRRTTTSRPWWRGLTETEKRSNLIMKVSLTYMDVEVTRGCC